MKKHILAALSAGLILSACASSSNMIVEPNRTTYRAQDVVLEYDASRLEVEQDSVDELRHFMENEFFGPEGRFARGSGLRVRYGFVTFDEGSQAARYFLGGIGGGEAKMVVRAEFLDAQGNTLAVIQSEGELGMGFFGGDAGSAIEGAAQEIANYAETNFASMTSAPPRPADCQVSEGCM